MVASLHASKEESYYQAYAQLQAALALPSATLDAPTVRAAAVAAFNAEQRRRSSTSRAPDSVLGFAAAAARFRRPFTGTSTPASSCCRCPHHCLLPDGAFRVVRPVEAYIAAVPDRDPEADVSDKTLRAYKQSLQGCTFYLCSLFLFSFWCWPASCAESCQQGGGSTRTHFLYFLCFYVLCIFSSHTPLSFERESSETILLFSDSGGSEVG